MHPFYGPSSKCLTGDNYWWLGLVSMAMYLCFLGYGYYHCCISL